MNERSITEVVAALIWQGDRFLVCQRPANKRRGLLWEFAGGKVEEGETKREALARECREELAVTLDVGDAFMDVTHEYPDLTVHLTLFEARIRSGEPTLVEHAAMKWITAEETDSLAFCPADTVILERLRAFAGRTDTFRFGEMTVRVLHPAEGEADTIVYVDYVGRRPDGTVFDTSIRDTARKYDLYSSSATYSPMKMKVAAVFYDSKMIASDGSESSLINGFTYAVKKMQPGEWGVALFHQEMGYAQSSQAKIPAYSPLLFELRLVMRPSRK